MEQKDRTNEPGGERRDDERDSGRPGGGVGRRDEVGGSGVFPASAGSAPKDAVIRTPVEWGQGDRGAAGYEDSGTSEIFYYDAELEAAGIKPKRDEGEEPAAEEKTEEEGEELGRS